MSTELMYLISSIVLLISFIVCLFSLYMIIIAFKTMKEVYYTIIRNNEVFLECFKDLKNVNVQAQYQNQPEIPCVESNKTLVQPDLLDVLKNAPITNFGSRTNVCQANK